MKIRSTVLELLHAYRQTLGIGAISSGFHADPPGK
jgi:hypothetical protein